MRHQKPAISDLYEPVPPFIVDHEFDDVDELAEITKAWDLDFRQLSRGGFRGSVRQAVIGEIHLAQTSLAGVLLPESDPIAKPAKAASKGWLKWPFAADYRRQFGELPSETFQRMAYQH